MNDKRDQLYDNLINSGRVSENEIGNREQFKAAIKDEAASRQFYNNIINSGALTPDEIGTEDDFYGSISSDFATPQEAAPAGYQPSAEDMAGFMGTINRAGKAATGSVQSFDQKAQNLQKRQGLNVPQRVNVGESNNLVQGEKKLNPETGQLEDTYITSSGNEYDNKTLANEEQRQIDQNLRDERYRQSLPGQLDDAYAERDRLNEELGKIQGQWVDQDGRVHYGNRGNDESVAALEAALRQNQQRIAALEAERDDDGGTQFWRGFLDAAKNPSVQSFGLTDFDDMLQLMRIKSKMDTAIEAGKQPQLTDAEQALMQSTFLNNYAQQQYGENRGFMYRAGGISMQALPFMAEFMMTGGFGALSEKGAELGTKAAEKLALKGLNKTLMKNLGVVAGDVAAGWAMANTTGLFRTAGDVIQRNIGDVTMNPEGEYDFGEYDEEGNFKRGGKSLGRSIYEAEVANTLEYYTEKLGEHLQIGKWLAKGAEKMGLSKLSKVVNYLSGNKWMEAGGIQDYPSEVVEEQANLLLNAMLVGDNTFSNPSDPQSVINPKTQMDIWGGMLFSIGLMQAPRLAQTGYSAIGYYTYKNATDVADANASAVFGANNWQMIKEQIDSCPNEDLGELMNTVIKGGMNDMQKRATMDYAANLIKMRGYNMGMMAGTKNEEESMSDAGVASKAVNQSYTQGHETQNPDLLKQYNDEAQQAAANLPQYGQEFARMITASQDPVSTLTDLMNKRDIYTDEQISAAADYFQKMSRINGALDGALSRVDLEVERMKAETRANTHQQTGNVVMAKGADNMDYYVIGGDIVTDPDTGLTSLVGTGGAVVVRDAITGEVSVKSPQEVMVYSMQPSEQIQNYYETEVRDALIKKADDDFTFGSPANEVYQLEDTVTLNDGEGNIIEGEIGMMPNAVDGVYVVYTPDGKALQYTADQLNRMIVSHNGQEVQRAAQQASVAETQQQTQQQGSDNIPNDNIPNQRNNATENIPEQEEQPQSALSRIPVLTDENGKPVLNKKGKPKYQWHKASVEDAAAALIETTGGDMVMARDTASDLVKNAQAGLEKIRKQKPKGEDPIEIAESRMEIRRQEQEQQAIIKQWQDVNHAIQKQMRDEAAARQAEIEAAKSEEQRQREAEEARIRKEKQEETDRQRIREQIEKDKERRNKEYSPLTKAREEMAGDADALAILDNIEPRSLEEWVSSLLRPHSMLWQDASQSEVGLQSELGLKRGDMQRMMSLLGTKESGAKPFGKVVLDIYESLPEGMKNQYTDEDVRNTLLDLFNEGSSTRMMHLTEENRIEEAREMLQENLRRDAEAELEAWAESYHLTPEERETFEEYLEMPPTEPEIEIINNIIGEQEYEQSERSAGVDQQLDGGTDGGEAERSNSKTLQTDQSESKLNIGEERSVTNRKAEKSKSPVLDNTLAGGTPTVEQQAGNSVPRREQVSPKVGTNQSQGGNKKPAEPIKKRKPNYSDFSLLNVGNVFVTPEGTIEIARIDYDRLLVHDIDENGNRSNRSRVVDTADGIKSGTIKPAEQLQESSQEPQKSVKRPDTKTPEGEILVKGGTILKNNMAGGDAVALIVGSNIDKKTGKRRYTVEYYTDEQDAKERSIAIGDAEIGQDEMRQHLANGDFSKERKAEQPKKKEPKRLVSDDKMEELRKKLLDKLNNLNAGVDPEMMLLGAMYAVGNIERGFTKFADYAREMINGLNDKIRPYLKAFYNAVRDMPEAAEYADQMDDYQTVASFDVYNFDKQQIPDAITKAEQVVKEQKINKQAKKIKAEQPNLFAGDLFGGEAAVPQQQTQQQPIGKTSSAQEIKAEEAKVDTNPSEAQKEAGNYQKGHINIDGYDITIENPKGSTRSGVDQNGNEWSQEMHNTYGYIRGTEGVDGDHIDVFLSNNPTSGQVFVVDQVNTDGSFDEHKVMYGFADAAEATQAYLSNYSPGWNGLGAITGVSREAFKEWVNSSHRKTKPFREYALAKREQSKTFRPATEEDLDVQTPEVYYQGKRVYIVAITRTGEQTSATTFSKPSISSIMLTNGKTVKLSDLEVKDEAPAKPKTAWWQDSNRPKSLDPKDYKTYMTDEAKEYFANFKSEDGKTDFTKWAHPNLAYITAAAWDGANIPVEELMQIPEIAEAEQRVKEKDNLPKFKIGKKERHDLRDRLLDAEHGSAVFENGKIKKVNDKEVFSGPVRQEKKAFVVVGRPAGGKSSVFANRLSHDNAARIVDSDVVKPWLSGYDDGYGAGYVQLTSADVASSALKKASDAEDNIVMPRIGGGSVMKEVMMLREKGYDVQIFYNEVSEETSIMRAASRFAQEGRYLSLDYLTEIGDKDSESFRNFAIAKLSKYYEQVNVSRSSDESAPSDDVLAGRGSGRGEDNRHAGGRGSEDVPGVVSDGLRSEGHEGGDEAGTSGSSEDELIFSYAEWKSNDVPFGEKPKEIWNSKSGKPMPTKEVSNNENERKVSTEPESAGEGTEQAGGSAGRTGAERSPESDRAERSGSGHPIDNTPDRGLDVKGSTTNTGGKPKLNNNRRNNVGERGKDYAPLSPKARFNANVEAIKMMRALMEDGVEAPTKDQMEVLRQYSGWGGLGTYFNDESSAENKILRDLLSDEEYNDAVMSINSAYFTPATVIDSMWDIAKAMGFKGGNVLEGSAGIGNIIGQMPTDMSRRSNIEAVEIDKISGNILKLLYPDANVHVQGFQDVKIPNGSIDLAITNVPFVTGLHVFDKVDKDLSRKFVNIHDFCIAKNIRKLKEGGIGIFISSSGTLDKSTELRQWIGDEGQADVVGAFRLNNETFGGTTATSDIIVVRKRTGNQKSPASIDVIKASPLRVGSYEDKYGEEHQVSMVVNDYFRENPDMMAGEMAFGYEKGDTFRPGSYGLYPVAGKDQNKMLADFAKSMSRAKEVAVPQQQTQQTEPNQLTAEKEGRMLVDDNGRLCVSQRGIAVPLGLNDQKVKGYTKAECFADYLAVQKAVDDALQQQLSDPDDAALKPKLDALNKAYDKFTKRYGTLHKNTAISFLRNDIDFPSFQALENYSETKDMKGKVTVITAKTPLFKQRVLGFKTEPKPKSVKDALIASIFRSNGIDLAWIADRLNDAEVNPPHKDKWEEDDVRKGVLVSRLGFEDPSTGQLEIRYKYLSGNVREKLAIAEAYNTDGKYSANVEELRKAVPMDIPSHLIDFSLGSSWIPTDLYKEYLKETLDLSNVKLSHIEGTWVLDEGYSYRNEKNRSAGVYSEKFRETIYGHQLVAAALNNRPVKVAKQVSEGWGSSKTTKTVVDQEATQACAVRVDEIKDEFKQWAKKKMQDDQELAQRIEKIYNDKFNALVPMQIDDEFLPETFEGANMNISLYDHQKRGVMRGLTAPTMLAHEVGTGKSFTLLSTAMEMRRLGTAQKPMIVVQNATVAQMTADAKLLYPNAKVLSLSEKDRSAEGRRAFYAKIKFNDWDIIIVPQSTFERIPDSPERELQFIQEKIDEKKHVIEAAQAAGVDSRELQRLKKELEKIEQEYGDVYLDNDPANIDRSKLDTPKKKKKDAKREAASLDKAETKAKEMLDRAVDDVQFFDDLGVDALLVDEAHEYKHLGFQTSIGRGIKGIDPSYSKKCAGLYNKTRSVFEKAGWKNVVFATGTPISNTAAEIWTFMKYLMPADVMKQNDIYYFDDFVHNFGNISQMLEFATSGKFKENTRFAAYVNKPELIRIWSQVADTVLTREVGAVKSKVPEKEGGKDQDVFLPQSPSLVQIMAAVRKELERFENMDGKQKKENSHIPLTMYGIAKRAAIDPRLVNADAPDEPLSKTNAAVKEIVKDLKATKSYKGTVAVFCDNQNRKGDDGSIEFNIYDDMREKLIAQGVPADQIAIIKSGMSIAAKQKVFDAVNSGAIRVVLGSTQTLGTGVNMQERLHLLIHMDAPDRPMDYTQRNGRIERQGNLHKVWGKPIRIVRFGVEDSLDVTAYQRLKTKSGFIDSIMDGKGALLNNQVDRTVEEEEEGLFDNPVAVLSGSQYALKKNQAERELRKYLGKKAQWEADQVYITNALRYNKSALFSTEENIGEEEKKLAKIRSMFPDGTVKTITVEGVKIDMTKDDGAKKLGEAIKEKINDPANATVKKLRENQIYFDENQRYTIELDGHPINFTVAIYRTSEWDGGKMKTVIHKGTSYSSPDLETDSMQSARSVRDYLDEIIDQVVTGRDSQDRIEAYRARIERINAESEQMRQREGQPFQYDKELEQARKNVEEYTELMKQEMKEKEAKYAEQQKEAEASGDTFNLSKAEENNSEDEELYRLEEEEEPMLREVERFEDGDLFPIHKSVNHSSFNVLGTSNTYSVDLLPDTFSTSLALLDAVRNQYPEYYVTISDDSIEMQTWKGVMDSAQNADTARRLKSKGTKSYIERKTRNAIDAVEYLAEKMHLDVEILTSTEGLTGKRARSKGFFNPKTGKITIVLPNHRTQSDVINTLLHEGVAHFGLRKMFGEHFNTFLDNVYNNAEPQIQARIDAAMKRNGWSRHTATEEYLARLAERTDFENATKSGWWKKIKDFFVKMLAEAGLRLDAALSDNDLRYILWRSYDNLIHPDSRRNIFDKAREVQMQSRLKVGNYAATSRRTAQAPKTTPVAAEPQEMLNSNISDVPSQELLLSLSQKEGEERNEAIDELTKRVGSGEARIARLGKEMERGRRTLCHRIGSVLGSQFLVAAENSDGTLGAGMHQGTMEAKGQAAKEELQVKNDILSWAKRNGYYFDEKEVEKNSLGGKLFKSAAESNVYRTKDGKKVIKFMIVSGYYRHGLLKRLDDLALQNALLSDPLDVIGFSENSYGGLNVVLEQDFIDGETVLEHFNGDTDKSNDYIDVYLGNTLGLREWYDEYGEFEGTFTRNGILYKDIHGGNVIIDKEGSHHIIDCQTEYKSDRFPNERMPGFSIEDDEQELYSLRTKKEADEMGLLYRDDEEGDVFVPPFEERYDVARSIYEQAAASDALKFQESWQDKMAGLKILQNAIEKETGNKATGAEDAYLYENRMHGKAKNQSETFERKYYQPVLKAADRMMKAKGWTDIRELTDYMVAKHGLERNIFYAFKEAVTGMVKDTINKEKQKLSKRYERGEIDAMTYKKEQKELDERLNKDVADKILEVHNDPEHVRMKKDYEDGKITYSDYITNEEDLRRKYAPDFDEHYRDYSGLTELTDSEDQYRDIALKMVDDAEDDAHNEANDLWKAVNAATKETLRFAYESGTMSRTIYNNVRAMFDYYIPLRGWEENNADDYYEYVSERNVFSTAVKKAYGRKSLAENPIAYIGNMAVSTLLAGHRNLLKQHFLNYVMNNPTSLVSVSEKWWENKGTETSPYWVEVAPEIPANATADQIADIVEAFNKEMQEKAEQGKATTKRGNLNIKYHATGAEKNEHMVEVQRAGKTYRLYVNGNPKAAQALNGINEKAVSRISQTDFGKLIERINRNMAAFFTSKNPAFVLSNLSRDLTMAGASVAVKEDIPYNAQFIKNVWKVLRPRTGRASRYGLAPQIVRRMTGIDKLNSLTGLLPSLMRKYLDGDLDLTNETERLFGEFMDEGAETGFVNMLSVDSFKDKMQKEIARMQGTTLNIGKARNGAKEFAIGKGLRLMGEIFEFYNRCAEDATRFIVFMTSRQMGKSLEDSIADAKDVTLNFNRKGTGAQWNAVVRDLFIFVNPAIQALSNMFKMAYKHPLKLSAVTAAFVAGGALMPIINQWLLNLFGDDDDKDAYWNLPPWVRKNNLVCWVPGTKNFITIPLAQEFRVFYGLGEMISSLTYDHPVHEWPLEILSSFMDLLPINPTGNGGNLVVDLTPTTLQPLMQLHDNVDFTGKPIWKENQGNKHAPMYTKAYITTPEWMVDLSEAVNDLTGGNEGKKGWIEDKLYGGNYINNPAVWNHLLQGYFGGMYNTIAKGFDVGVTMGKGEVPKVYQTPVLNRFLNRPVERDNAGVLGDEYYKLTEERDKTRYELRTWQKKAADGEEGAQEHVDEIMNSEDYQRMLVIDHYDKIMKDLKAGEKAATMDIDKADIKESITMYKAEMLEELADIDGGQDPLEAAKRKFDEATTFAERNRLRMRIEKLMAREGSSNTAANSTGGRSEEVKKALSYRSDEERESRKVNELYLQLATAQDIADDASIRAARIKIRAIDAEVKRLQRENKVQESIRYQKEHSREINAGDIIESLTRTMNDNKKLLGKGHDEAIMKLIDANRNRMLKAIEDMQ